MISLTDEGVLQYRDERGTLWQYPFTFQAQDGIAVTSHEERVIGLGCVLVCYCETQRSSLLIQKAPRENYEFSYRWAFPGGMVRQNNSTQVSPSCVAQSLAARVSAEAGLLIAADLLEPFGTPVPTTYLAKGRQREVMIVPFHAPKWCENSERLSPKSEDASIIATGWKPIHSVWNELAPANCCIAAQYFFPSLTDEERQSARHHIESSLKISNDLARSWKTHTLRLNLDGYYAGAD